MGLNTSFVHRPSEAPIQYPWFSTLPGLWAVDDRPFLSRRVSHERLKGPLSRKDSYGALYLLVYRVGQTTIVGFLAEIPCMTGLVAKYALFERRNSHLGTPKISKRVRVHLVHQLPFPYGIKLELHKYSGTKEEQLARRWSRALYHQSGKSAVPCTLHLNLGVTQSLTPLAPRILS